MEVCLPSVIQQVQKDDIDMLTTKRAALTEGQSDWYKMSTIYVINTKFNIVELDLECLINLKKTSKRDEIDRLEQFPYIPSTPVSWCLRTGIPILRIVIVIVEPSQSILVTVSHIL